nr:immunoglobulin heavy chain junction region [Macaca mulatta]MOY25115.1 immunoglobulin heavy chain junction region [Macaca mulatta]MOY26423.1 immunoglobulin heavy chain junction region [Macaca mulatta]MOY26882.1 immunoglobulin heavy chain junction region [Macaca mulatta]MOY28211.1 immunoglobulin heavy chain junction region [Macaca mulatta]
CAKDGCTGSGCYALRYYHGVDSW